MYTSGPHLLDSPGTATDSVMFVVNNQQPVREGSRRRV